MRPLSLYIHVPFCRSKCRYCDFASRPLASCAPGAEEAVVERLLGDARGALASLEETRGGLEVDTVFVGGGTPSALEPALLARLLRGIASLPGMGDGPREWTVECNPESLDPLRLDVLADAGVDRLSLGVQSLEDRALSLSGRPGDADDVRAALELLAGSWKGRWSADLMAGLPGQSPGGAARDAEACLDYGAGHLSLYSLILEEGTELARMAAADPGLLPSADQAADAWDAAAGAIRGRGLERYEVSNFARAGQECLHNLHYWRLDSWLGVGPSASSTLEAGEGGLLRMTEAADLSAWLSRRAAEKIRLSAREALEEWLLMGLRTGEGVDFSDAPQRFGLDPLPVLKGLLETWAEKGRARLDGRRFSLTEAGMDLMDSLLVDCFILLDAEGRGR